MRAGRPALRSGGADRQREARAHLWMRAPAACPNWSIWAASSSDRVSACSEKDGGRGSSHFCLSSQDFKVLSNA